MTRRGVLIGWALMVVACGSSSTSPTTPTLRTQTFNGSLDDPTRCTCGNGINQYTVEVGATGRLDAAATFQPADAALVVRLLDSSFNTVHAVSTRSGNTARLEFNVVPATYRMQVFLSSEGPRQATFALTVTHP
jgi:hypothetical protein